MVINKDLIKTLFIEYELRDAEVKQAKLDLENIKLSRYRWCKYCGKEFNYHQSLFAHYQHCQRKLLGLPNRPHPAAGRRDLRKPRKLAPTLKEELVLKKSIKCLNGIKFKNLLFYYGIFEHKCYNCNLTEWLSKPIPLEIEHINGNKFDNRQRNLTLLCPNCHSFTPTYRGRNKKRLRETKEIRLRFNFYDE